ETATVIVHGEAGKAVLAVPPTAIRWEGQQAYVLRATPDSKEGDGKGGEEARVLLERVDVTVHEDVSGRVAVEGPIAAGDRVVRSGPQTLVDGDSVQAIEAPASPAAKASPAAQTPAPTPATAPTPAPNPDPGPAPAPTSATEDK
ncbi:MAG: hypothetical protein KC431_14495, partial [Myxococcales bacterium]|nr:hypothetical protein [Myxococcales bacterium]